jgi:hypothetical protein
MNLTWNHHSKYPYTPSSRKDATAKGNKPLALLYLGIASNAAHNNQRVKKVVIHSDHKRPQNPA